MPVGKNLVALNVSDKVRLIGGVEILPDMVIEDDARRREQITADPFKSVYAVISQEGFNIMHTVMLERYEGNKHPSQSKVKCGHFLFVYQDIARNEATDPYVEPFSIALAKAQSSIESTTSGAKVIVLGDDVLFSTIRAVFSVAKLDHEYTQQPTFHPGAQASWSVRTGSLRAENIEEVAVGTALLSGRPFQSFTLPLETLSKHVSIFGSTGSGKTTTAKTLVARIFEHGIPFLILDVHNECRDLLNDKDSLLLGFDGKIHLDILEPYSFENANEHISTVTDVFAQIYTFSPSQIYMFREAFSQAFIERRLSSKSITLEGLVERIENYPTRSFYDNETKYALLRRLKPLASGEGKIVFSSGAPLRIDKIVSVPTCMLLGNIKSSDLRRLTAAMVLTLTYEYRLGTGRSKLNHVILIEEAQNLLPFRNRADPPNAVEKLFFEMRKYGEGLILVAQFPSQIFSDVVKSTGTRIVHRMTEMAEAPYISDILGLKPEECRNMKYLPVGKAYILTEGLSEAVVVEIEPEVRPDRAGGTSEFSTGEPSISKDITPGNLI